jgi:hypothetical protein
MIELKREPELGALRVQVAGAWSVDDLQACFATILKVHRQMASLMLLGEFVREEKRINEIADKQKRYENQQYSWSQLFQGPSGRRDDDHESNLSLEAALSATEPYLVPLLIDAIRIESPGWIQIIGHLNPLKVTADFISRWRSENTKRQQFLETSAIKREQHRVEAALERERIRSNFAAEVLRLLPSGERVSGARLIEITQQIINPGAEALQRLAMDHRVVDADIVEPGELLPSFDTEKSTGRGIRLRDEPKKTAPRSRTKI